MNKEVIIKIFEIFDNTGLEILTMNIVKDVNFKFGNHELKRCDKYNVLINKMFFGSLENIKKIEKGINEIYNKYGVVVNVVPEKSLFVEFKNSIYNKLKEFVIENDMVFYFNESSNKEYSYEVDEFDDTEYITLNNYTLTLYLKKSFDNLSNEELEKLESLVDKMNRYGVTLDVTDVLQY